MGKTYQEKYQEWIKNPTIDKDTKKELKSITNNDREIEDRFFQDLSFRNGRIKRHYGCWQQQNEHIYS